MRGQHNGLIGTHLIPASVEHGMPEVETASFLVGAAAMAYGAGAIRDILGDYGISFVIAGVMCMIAVGMVAAIRAGQEDFWRGQRSQRPGRLLLHVILF